MEGSAKFTTIATTSSGRELEVAGNNSAVDLPSRKSGHVVLEHPVRDHKNDSIPARIAKDPERRPSVVANGHRAVSSGVSDLPQAHTI
jgi:hypothetical protein